MKMVMLYRHTYKKHWKISAFVEVHSNEDQDDYKRSKADEPTKSITPGRIQVSGTFEGLVVDEREQYQQL